MAYTYLIGWRKLDKWYYGYRNRDNPESDLWVEYFTSSKYVKEFRELHGEPDVVRVHRVFPDKNSAMVYEDRFLYKVKAVRSSRWLNRGRRGIEFRSPDKFSDESRKRMSDSQKAYRASNKKVTTARMSENARRQIERVNELGLRASWTKERCARISSALVGNTNRLGLKNSEEQNRRIAESAKYRPMVCCVVCRRVLVVNAMSQHARTHYPNIASGGS